ncbi:hypothetical protein PC114_g9085 [Phytophthora cactorum]|nr:hypothetical protein PC114_g9085 [Phytophthora cactorum]KAG3156407.1 hypothetical protein C6341_g15095 [Phytophthora cactorum]
MPGTLRDVSYSEELNVALGMTTRWVAAAIKTQYDIAMDAGVANNYTFSDNGATITIKGGEREYLLEKDGLLCDCEFSQTMYLPCRHTMVYRKSCGNPFIIPFSSVAPRCFGQCRLSQQELIEVATPFMANICKAHSQAGGGSLSEAEKYRHAQQSFGHISGELARDSAWLNDDAMHGFAVFLARYKYNVTVVISPPKTYKVAQKKKATEGLLPATTLDKIGEGVVSHPFVLLQVNFGGTHWGCLVVDRGAKLVKMYDSMGGKRNRKRLQNMAAEIRAGPLHYDSYNDLEVTEPMQTDSDSCGVFVYRLFWTCVSSKAPSGVSPAGVTKLRWDMLHAIMKVQPR